MGAAVWWQARGQCGGGTRGIEQYPECPLKSGNGAYPNPRQGPPIGSNPLQTRSESWPRPLRTD